MTQPHPMDRREMLKLGGAAAIALLAPAGTVFVAAAPGRASASTIVLADPRYAESVSLAASLERQGAKVIELASDRARTWFDAVEPRLPAGLRALAGLTLESDLFVLERLAERSGARTCYVGLHDWRCRQDSVHLLSATIELDPIATALVNGKEGWAESLGKALGNTNIESREERSLALNCPMLAASGPRFFVSWLMRWTG
ncbi:MAG TPA: hypothetical protein VLE24_02190 [Methyloceanibacter sp.]|nr:hypothetical protein [Methyloceanibacter sp.]